MMRATRKASSAAALLWASCSAGCSTPTVTTFFREVAYAPGGASLVLVANDGVYVAHPPSATPRRATDRACAGPARSRLSCARMSADGRRIALLTAEKSARGVFDLGEVQGNGGRGIPAEDLDDLKLLRVASGVLDAAFSPDGAELVWARAGAAEGTIALERLSPSGAAVELVHAIPVVAGADAPMGAAVLGTYGVAYPRPNGSAVELWYQPFDGGPAQGLGTLPEGCAGTAFSRCLTRSSDGSSFSWQERDGGVYHVFRGQKEVDLPLGTGYGLAFSRSGAFLLRMAPTPSGASVTSVDTAAVVRRVWNADSAELSSDGESIAYLTVDSKAKNTARLFVGASRHEGVDQDFGAFEAPDVHPMVPQALGVLDVVHAYTGDGRYVIVTAKGDEPGSAKLVSVEVATGEGRALGALSCSGCCMTAPAGALVVCAPALASGGSEPVAVDLYDPATGQRAPAADAAIDVQALADGSGVAVLNMPSGRLPELRVVARDGRVVSLGIAVGFAASPKSQELAIINELGNLSVEPAP
jgi:hypothetical protein